MLFFNGDCIVSIISKKKKKSRNIFNNDEMFNTLILFLFKMNLLFTIVLYIYCVSI